MPRDYAQRGNNNRRQARGRSKAASKAGLPGWVWLIAGLSAGLAVAAFVYITRPVDKVQIAQAEPAPTKAPRVLADKNAPIPIPPKEKPRFTFYEILKNQEVVVPKEETRKPTAPRPSPGATPPPGGSDSYIVQVASFRGQADADRLKANLALLGIESRIESITIDGKDTYYRVRVGPERDWNKVQTTMARLDENGIEGLLIKLQ